MGVEKNLELRLKWSSLMGRLGKIVGQRPKDLNSVLYLIGIQELGKGVRDFTKEEKQDLMHIAVCKLLSGSGYYELEGLDEDGWPHWKKKNNLPRLDLIEQESFLKSHIIDYFESELNLNSVTQNG